MIVGERAVDNLLNWGWDICAGVELDSWMGVGEGFFYGAPDAPVSHANHFWSHHAGGAHFLMADGAVHFLNYSIDNPLWLALATRAGDEPIGDF